MTKLVEDLETLTTIPESTLNKLIAKVCFCICEAVEESVLAHEQITEIDVGIGTLYIQTVEDSVKYKFIPSAKLNEAVVTTIKEGKSPLVKLVEATLKDRITNVYKQLL